MAPDQPQAPLWNPAGLSLKKAAQMLAVWSRTVAILGGNKIFGLFLPRYNVFTFRASRACDCRSGGLYS